MAGYATPSWTNNDSPPMSAANLTALGEAVEIAEHPYGVCSTAAATAAKTVTIDFSGTLALFTGLTVRVKFTNANTAASPTLNVNGTGDAAIVFSGAAVGNGAWMAGEVMEFTYDGTSWNISNSPVDAAPASGSSNMAQSGGIYDYADPNIGKGTNILRNWYMVGGGSQQGGNQLPINTRGLTGGVPTSVATINVWTQTYSSSSYKGTWSLDANGYTMTAESDSSGVVLQQGIRNGSVYVGQNLTATVLFADGSMRTGTIVRTSATQTFFAHDAGTYTDCRLTNNNNFQIRCYGNGVSTTIAAVKLEVGDHQTFLRQENGTWVLNDSIPDYQYAYVMSVGVETSPTANSANLITSGGVASAIAAVAGTVPVRGLWGSTFMTNGQTCTLTYPKDCYGMLLLNGPKAGGTCMGLYIVSTNTGSSAAVRHSVILAPSDSGVTVTFSGLNIVIANNSGTSMTAYTCTLYPTSTVITGTVT